jgi:hypothetical protein
VGRVGASELAASLIEDKEGVGVRTRPHQRRVRRRVRPERVGAWERRPRRGHAIGTCVAQVSQ